MKRPDMTGLRAGARGVGLLGAVVAIGAVLAWADLIQAQPPSQSITSILEAKAQRTPAQRKLSSQLLDATGSAQPSDSVAHRQTQAASVKAEQSPTAGVKADQPPTVDVEDEVVTVDIRADVTPAVLARIRALGGTVLNSVPQYRAIRARLPLTALEPLARLDAVQFIRPADQPITHQLLERSAVARAVVTEGDVAHQANVARSTHSVDGTGIGIGVLSDGVDALADQQATGEVPAGVTVLPGQAGGAFQLSCGRRSKGTEGTAMFEIVHDLAPDAELFFATGGGGAAQMAQNIEDLCAAGADIIVDDIGYLLAPAFQDGVIAQAVSAAVANGCYYFSAAGNGGNLNDGTSGVWEGDFAAGPALSLSGVKTGAVYHDFDPDPDNAVTRNEIEKDSTLLISLQWADPVGASANDYDLFLIDAANTVLASSTNTQDGSQDPIEYISGACSNDYEGARLVIVKNAGAADRYLRLNTGGELAIATAGQTFGHSASQDAIGVAAVSARTAGGAGGVFNGTESVETFSSDGPRRMFFEANGTPVTPGNFSSTGGELLQKPDLTAADAVSTSTPGFATFKGTSAAAPHAAGIAALMLEAAGGPAKVTLDELHTAMTRTESVVDIEEMGVDRDSGAGIVMAPGAVAAVAVDVGRNRAPTVESALTDQPFEPGDDPVTIDLDDVFDDPNNDPLTYTMQLLPDTPTVTLAGSMLTLAPAGPSPTVMVTVRATDPDGLTTTRTFSVTVTAGPQDYDVDNDNLIDVSTLAQLDAIRYDLNGDGWVDGATWQPYYAAFVEGTAGMGCPDGCVGYELAADLDFFDTNEDGQVDTSDDTNGDGQVDAEDNATYWNGGAGWVPIGEHSDGFDATFEGNRRTINHLFIDRGDFSGLFGGTGSSSLIRRLGLVDADVTGDAYVGGLAAEGAGDIRSSYVTGRVSGDYAVGGLIGFNNGGTIAASYATARVTGDDLVGGLTGLNSGQGRLLACYATGRVSGEEAGGLVGLNNGAVAASYATGRVLGAADVGGLAGSGSGVFRSSYWDRETSGVRVGVGADDLDADGWLEAGESRTPGVAGWSTSALQTPTGYDDIYRTWNIDLDDDASARHCPGSSCRPAVTPSWRSLTTTRVATSSRECRL